MYHYNNFKTQWLQKRQNRNVITITKNTEIWDDDKKYGDFEGFWTVKTFLT